MLTCQLCFHCAGVKAIIGCVGSPPTGACYLHPPEHSPPPSPLSLFTGTKLHWAVEHFVSDFQLPRENGASFSLFTTRVDIKEASRPYHGYLPPISGRRHGQTSPPLPNWTTASRLLCTLSSPVALPLGFRCDFLIKPRTFPFVYNEAGEVIGSW